MGTRFEIDRDYAKEITSASKSLWAQYKHEKQNPRTNAKLVYPAKLIVNGKCIAVEYPYWHDVLHMNRCDIFRNESDRNRMQNISVYSTETNVDLPCASMKSSEVLDSPAQASVNQLPSLSTKN